MTISPHQYLLLFTALLTALMAGLFFNWSTAITGGLGKLPDRDYLSAFQSINRAIQNPVFIIVFLGTAIMLPLCCYRYYRLNLNTPFYLLLAACLIYIAGVMAVTIAGNLPLNEALDKFDPQKASIEEIRAQRKVFEGRWNLLNTVRTVSAISSLILVLLACLYKKAV